MSSVLAVFGEFVSPLQRVRQTISPYKSFSVDCNMRCLGRNRCWLTQPLRSVVVFVPIVDFTAALIQAHWDWAFLSRIGLFIWSRSYFMTGGKWHNDVRAGISFIIKVSSIVPWREMCNGTEWSMPAIKRKKGRAVQARSYSLVLKVPGATTLMFNYRGPYMREICGYLPR